jgi:hypothetical protein
MTIPTIAETLDGLLAGGYTREQALVWIDQHIAAAIAAAADRDTFAAQTIQALMADRRFLQDARNSGADPFDAVATAAYAMADSMKRARTA